MAGLQLVQQSAQQIHGFHTVQAAVFFAFAARCTQRIENHGMGHGSSPCSVAR